MDDIRSASQKTVTGLALRDLAQKQGSYIAVKFLNRNKILRWRHTRKGLCVRICGQTRYLRRAVITEINGLEFPIFHETADASIIGDH